MNFIADENIDRQIVERLRYDGHDVRSVAEMDPGISDDEVLDMASRESAILLTADRDFGELVFRQQRIMAGVILVRLAGLSPTKKAVIVSVAISQHIAELPNAFVVVSPGRVRIRSRIA
jgi:predicted nuclease of predicted toxin-antitoxin system